MKPLAEQSSAAPPDRHFADRSPVLEELATRFRGGGLFLSAIRNDGSVAWHDAAANIFFLRYLLPLLHRPELNGLDLIGMVSAAAGSLISGPHLPGVVLAIVPHIVRRQTVGALIVAGRDETFSLGEDLLRMCGRLELDAAALGQLARELPAYNETSIARQARLLTSCFRDQLRVLGLEQEVNSISEQLSATYEELSLIYQVSSGMKVNRSADDFFRQTCSEVLAVMGMRGLGVALSDENGRKGRRALYGEVDLPEDLVVRMGDEVLALLQKRRTPLLVNDLEANAQINWLGEHARQLLAVPLQRHDKTFGCLFALDKPAGEFDSSDAKLLSSIANESAIYLENAQLFDDIRGLMMGLLHSLTSAVDAKDAYTCGHSERVALLSRHLAQAVGLPEFEVEQIYIAGLLHDVGKIGVPESVLQKPGKLTPEEFEQMKKHPLIGAHILQDVRQVQALIPGVLHHHERYDGKGYPHGLVGDDIPLMGRIICLADSFDAMTSSRTYRSALPLEVALAEIRRCSGTQFDPALVETFLRTGTEGYRELLKDHQQKSKLLLDQRDNPAHAR